MVSDVTAGKKMVAPNLLHGLAETRFDVINPEFPSNVSGHEQQGSIGFIVG